MADLPDFLDEMPTADTPENAAPLEEETEPEAVADDYDDGYDDEELPDGPPTGPLGNVGTPGVPTPVQTTQTTVEHEEAPETPPKAAVEETFDTSKTPPHTAVSTQVETERTAEAVTVAQEEPELTEPAEPAEQADLVETKELVTLGGSKLPKEIVHLWDTMMAGFSNATRNAVWEKGLDSMESLMGTPVTYLLRPRGPMRQAQVDELNAYLATLGYILPARMATNRLAGRQPGIPVGGNKTPVDNLAAREARNKRFEKMANCR